MGPGSRRARAARARQDSPPKPNWASRTSPGGSGGPVPSGPVPWSMAGWSLMVRLLGRDLLGDAAAQTVAQALLDLVDRHLLHAEFAGDVADRAPGEGGAED